MIFYSMMRYISVQKAARFYRSFQAWYLKGLMKVVDSGNGKSKNSAERMITSIIRPLRADIA